MSKQESNAAQSAALDDDEPDEWDKRIFSTGYENMKLTDCYFEKKDWRKCTEETAPPAPAPTAAPPPPPPPSSIPTIDWSTSYHGLSTAAFPPEVAAHLTTPISPADIEVKPDGIIYLPEIKYRRILNAALGPAGWGLVPRGPPVVADRTVTREYALVAQGRFIAQAQGENQFFAAEALPAAVEGCKSNALMRCCKDIGVASELWDPVFIRAFQKQHAEQVWVEHVVTKKKKQLWVKKGLSVGYPYKKT
ncbi:Ubiquitin carboxyl-terminal hydrolase 21 [Verticillium dahliae VDG2]|nr:Ubiquitin carboxyl-terminal hydrolase 21 [Verticillium dahliae VDG2]